MNDLLKCLEELNYKAFRAVKRAEYKILGILYDRKVNSILKKDCVRTDYKNEHDLEIKSKYQDMVADKLEVKFYFEDYPTILDVNRFLREECGEKYPQFIISKKLEDDITLILKLAAITDEEIHKRPYVQFANPKGLLYTYKEYVDENNESIFAQQF
jgi:hypothetical protein